MKKTNTIFIIDDDPQEVAVLIDAVFSIDNSIICFAAHNGVDALEFLNNAILLPQMIILDVQLPRLDGPTFLSTIKKDERFSDIPVVMFSESFQNSQIAESKKAGAADFIKKPETFEDFRKIRNTIKKHMPSLRL